MAFRKAPAPKWDVVTPLLATIALAAVCAIGWVAVDKFLPAGGSAPVTTTTQVNNTGRRVAFSMCGRDRYTCVVDGDTVWFEGQNLQLQSFDTPEPYDGICGGRSEVALAKRASARLLQLLNANAIAVETFGPDNTGDRTVATIWIGGRDVGDILIEEGLARRWPDGDEFWC